MSVLDFREGEKEADEDEGEQSSYLLRRPWIPPPMIVLATFWPRPRLIPAVLCSTCLLSRNDIVNDNNTPAYREVSAVTPAEWRRDGMGWRSAGALLRRRVRR